MNDSDKLFLGKKFIDYTDSMRSIESKYMATPELRKEFVEKLPMYQGIFEEMLTYESILEKLIIYSVSNGVSIEELMQLGEEYKELSVVDFYEMKKQVTIEEELNELGII